jgi:hypothetical protein
MAADWVGSKNPNYRGVWIQRKPMLEEYCKQGLTIKEMSRRFRCNRRHVLEAIRKYGLQKPVHTNRGSNNPAWRGGEVITKTGYVKVYAPEHPHRDRHNKVWKHRLVMEQKVGRYLEPQEVVHHIDGNGMNNHPDNLELFANNADHLRHTLKGRVPNWTEDGKRRISESTRQMNLRRPPDSEETRRRKGEGSRRAWQLRRQLSNAEAATNHSASETDGHESRQPSDRLAA